MGSYTGDLKCNLKSVRMTDKVYEYVMSFDGEGFNQKFENLVLYFMEQEKQQRNIITELDKQIQLRWKELQCLEKGTQLMENVFNSLREMEETFRGEALGNTRNAISLMIHQAGYVSKEEVVSNIFELNQLCGKNHNLKEIYRIFKNQSYEMYPEQQRLVNDIVTEFQHQEMSMPEPEPG